MGRISELPKTFPAASSAANWTKWLRLRTSSSAHCVANTSAVRYFCLSPLEIHTVKANPAGYEPGATMPGTGCEARLRGPGSLVKKVFPSGQKMA
jgi:hypothetical protein